MMRIHVCTPVLNALAIVGSACLGFWGAPAQAIPAPFLRQTGTEEESAVSRAVEHARAHHRAAQSEILREYSELLALPNVASDLPNIRKNAEWIVRAFARRNVELRLLEHPETPPLVYGEIRTPGARRTIGIYVHYDGQPVSEEEWYQSPWKPTLYTGAAESGGVPREFPKPGESVDPECRIYARAASDDKAPLQALLSALDALRNSGIALTSNFRFLFEGEEEAGSPHLGELMRKHRSLLLADVWLICDGPVHTSRRPQLMFGVRGYSGLDITVYGATRNLHSGHYGNWAPNPALLLAQLLGSMKDDDGNVLIEGFHDTVSPLTAADREALASIPDSDDDLRKELGLSVTDANNAPYIDRILLPSLNIRGFSSGTVGETARNIVPNTARASLDVRLVKGNDPADMLDRVEAHIRKRGYKIVRAEPDLATRRAHPRIARVLRTENYPAARTSMDLPIVRQVIRAAEEAASEPVVLLPTLGGSLPLYLFTDELASPTVIVPIVNHDNNQHAPNENLRLQNLWDGIELLAALLAMPPAN